MGTQQKHMQLFIIHYSPWYCQQTVGFTRKSVAVVGVSSKSLQATAFEFPVLFRSVHVQQERRD